MWHNFVTLWNRSIYFKGAVAVFVTGMILMLK
jgi:hypothetical protein